MSVRLHDERAFQADAQTLLEIWKDESFQCARSKHLGTIGAECIRDGDTIALTETRDTGWKPHLYVTQLTTTWRELEASWELVRLEGPGDAGANGTLHIVEAGASCRMVLDGVLEVRVPVLGGMIERLARRALVVEREREAEFVRGWIAQVGGG